MSSMAHKSGTIFFDDLAFNTIAYRPFKVDLVNKSFSLCYTKKLEVLLLIISGIQPVKACKYSLHKRTSKVRPQKETVGYQRLVRIGLLREIFPLCSFSLRTMNNKKEKKGRVVLR